jgi:predicted GH43/DUF377 family glycosyl hydrolase
MNNFTQLVLQNRGSIHPLIIPFNFTNGTGLFNPSILNYNDKILVNIRHCQYTLYHSELSNYEHQWGPLLYLNPEDDLSLTTTNYFCELDDNLNIIKFSNVNTDNLDKEPLWEFVGLEDARILYWDNKFYLCGVRRDTTPNGVGRMELSEIEITQNEVIEVQRFRIPMPNNIDSYCEKNWMPISNIPFHFVKWTNPTEVVKYIPEKNLCETVYQSNQYIQLPRDLRGGSQVIPYKDGYIAITHEVYFYDSEAGRKDGTYRHRFVLWDKNWNIIKITEEFNFMGAKIEFACGMTKYRDSYLITFGFQDNCAYLLKVPEKFLENFIYAS